MMQNVNGCILKNTLKKDILSELFAYLYQRYMDMHNFTYHHHYNVRWWWRMLNYRTACQQSK